MLAKSMRQAYCPSSGTVLIREVPVPRPAEGEVLLRVRSCGICGSDLHWYGGATPPPPVCPGHELVAEVAAVGSGVRGSREGDRVTAEAFRSCGSCMNCRIGRAQRCPHIAILGLDADGAFADYVLTDAARLFALPTDLSDDLAQLTEPVAVGVHAMRMAELEPGQRVLILGAGSIGLLATLAARAAGAGEIVVSARRPHQRDAALGLGADHVVSPAVFDSPQSAPGGFDVVLDTVADPEQSLDQGLAAVRSGGTIVVVGVYTGRASFDAVRLMSREVRVVGAMCYGQDGSRADFEVAMDILRRADRACATLLTHRVGLDEIAEGFGLAADKTTGSIKVCVAMSTPDSSPLA